MLRSEREALIWLTKKGYEIIATKGAPDFLCRDKEGNIVLVEAKTNKDTLKPNQVRWLHILDNNRVRTKVLEVDMETNEINMLSFRERLEKEIGEITDNILKNISMPMNIGWKSFSGDREYLKSKGVELDAEYKRVG